MLLITYTAILVLFIINFRSVMQSLGAFIYIFNPLFIGIAIAFILNRPCMYIDRLLRRRKVLKRKPSLARGLAVTITYILLFLIIALLISIVIPQLIESIGVFVNNAGTYLDNSQDLINKVARFTGIHNIDLSSSGISKYINQLAKSATALLGGIINITTGIISFIATLLISMIFSIYLLSSKETLLRQCKRVFVTYLPLHVYRKASYIYHVITDTFQKYIIGQLTDACILGVLCFIGMLIFRFEYPVLISVLIGVSALVPMLGAYIGGGIAFLLLLMVTPVKALWFILFLIVLQQFEGNIIYPRVVGSSLGLPGIWVLLAIIVGSGVAGTLGILLGVPVFTVLYILFKDDLNQRTADKELDSEKIEDTLSQGD